MGHSMFRTGLLGKALLVLTLVGTTLLSVVPPANAAETWEYLGTDQGVKVWRKEVAGSGVFAFRGEITANVHIGKLVSVFIDRNQRKYWVDRFDDTKTLDMPTPLSEVYWIKFKLPFPVSDRDYILRADAMGDVANKIFTAKIKSVVDPRKPKDDCCVRAEVYGTYYKFTALPGTPERTKLEVEVHTDPKGMLPDWLINLIQKKWPSKTLSGLLARVQKVNPPPFAELANWHTQ